MNVAMYVFTYVCNVSVCMHEHACMLVCMRACMYVRRTYLQARLRKAMYMHA